MINEQNDKIDKILSKLQERDDAAVEGKRGKDKGKKSKSEFYQVNIWFNIFFFVYAIFILIINFIHIS